MLCSKVTNLKPHRLTRFLTGTATSVTQNQSSWIATEDYQLLRPSKLPTFHFHQSLPRLPIPSLEKTCERFLAAVQPIVDPDLYHETKLLTSQFRQGAGQQLHRLLKKHDAQNKHTSYISEPWFDAYLKDRSPLPLNYNPLLVMKNEPRDEYRSQLIRASNLVVSSLRFWRSLKMQVLDPEVYYLDTKSKQNSQFRLWIRFVPSLIATYVSYAFKAIPLDMTQYTSLFGVSRIPQIGKDRLSKTNNPKHILVMVGGNFYAVDVLNKYDEIEPPAEILGRLMVVMETESERAKCNLPLGVLTTTNRDVWAKNRQHLCNISIKNKTLLEEEVDAALFCLCLDSPDEPMYNENDPSPILKHLLSGHGRNRWFDKSVSLIVSADGTAAVNFEHSWGDGLAILRYFNEIHKETSERPWIHNGTAARMPSRSDAVRPLKFDIDCTLSEAICRAVEENRVTLNKLNMNVLHFKDINKGFCKEHGVSADAIMQLAFQLAYRRIFRRYVGTYESCSTAAFRHGRTETMRPCTMATKVFCDTVLYKTKCIHSKLRDLVDDCSRLHGKLTKEAAMGQGFDRHLFALKHLAIKNGMDVPNLYKGQAYQQLNRHILSTSTLSSDALLAGAFGPVVPNGLGIGYSIQDDACGAIITSYQNGCDGAQFTHSLEKAFEKLHTIIKTPRH